MLRKKSLIKYVKSDFIKKNQRIIIHAPYICDVGNKARLCADIECNGDFKTLYFEVDSCYKDGLCTERSDAFIIALLATAMEWGCDIKSDIPMSTKLYYQITTYFIPIMARYIDGLTEIEIVAELNSEILPSHHGVGVGASGGVDSFYSIIKHLDIDIPQYKLTHVIFNNASSFERKEDSMREWFEEQGKVLGEMTDELGLNLVKIFTNLYEFYAYPYNNSTFVVFSTPVYVSCTLALQKLIGIYYQSSGYTLDDFTVDFYHDISNSDVFNLKCLSNENVLFYSSGTEKTRMEKVEYIADNPVVQKYLYVCFASQANAYDSTDGILNCGICTKCMRTVGELYALDKLSLFEKIFHTEIFKKNKQKYIAKMQFMNSTAYSKEIIDLLKKKSNLNFGYYFWAAIYGPIYWLKRKLSGFGFLRRLYYALNLDIKLLGVREEGVYEAYTKIGEMKNDNSL